MKFSTHFIFLHTSVRYLKLLDRNEITSFFYMIHNLLFYDILHDICFIPQKCIFMRKRKVSPAQWCSSLNHHSSIFSILSWYQICNFLVETSSCVYGLMYIDFKKKTGCRIQLLHQLGHKKYFLILIFVVWMKNDWEGKTIDRVKG